MKAATAIGVGAASLADMNDPVDQGDQAASAVDPGGCMADARETHGRDGGMGPRAALHIRWMRSAVPAGGAGSPGGVAGALAIRVTHM